MPPLRAESLDEVPEPAASSEASDLPPQPPSETGRSRPNFLAAFLARRSALAKGEGSGAHETPSVEPTLVPLSHPDVSTAPARTAIDLSSGWDEPGGAAGPEPARGGHDRPAIVDLLHPVEPEPSGENHEASAEPEPAGVEEDQASAAPEEPAVSEGEAEAVQPVIVGRYNAGSASYIMYSNGMIEVETDSGTHQFASMQELKAFIERRDAARV